MPCGSRWTRLESSGPRRPAHCRAAAAVPRRGGLDRGTHRSGQPTPECAPGILSGGPRSLRGLEAAGSLGLSGNLSHPCRAQGGRPTQMGKVPSQPQAGAAANLRQTPGDLRPGQRVCLWRSAHPHQEPVGAHPHADAARARASTRGLPRRNREAFCPASRSRSFRFAPRSGSQNCPALAGRNRSERARFDTSALQCLAGTAPISYQSGQIHIVALRRHCNKALRAVVHLWANLSRQCSPWAAVYYQALRPAANPMLAPCAAWASAGLRSSGKGGKPANATTPNSMPAINSNTAHGSSICKALNRSLPCQ